MLSYNDTISQFKQRVNSESLNASYLLAAYAELYEITEYFEDGVFGNTDLILAGEDPVLLCTSLTLAFINENINKPVSIVMDDGRVITCLLKKYESGQSGTYYINVVYNNNEITWYSFSYHLKQYSVNEYDHCYINGVDRYNGVGFGSFIQKLSEAFSNSELLSKASELALQGKLSGETLRVNFLDSLSKMNSNTKTLLNSIGGVVTGNNASIQCLQLCSTIKNIGSGYLGLSANNSESKINFTTDRTVDTSLLLPISTIVNLASAALSVVISFIATPLVGLLVSGVGAAISGVVSLINENNSDDMQITNLDQIGNFCYCNSIYQKIFNNNEFPDANLKQTILKCGYIKLVNGLFTIYMWTYDSSSIAVEVFINMTCDPSRSDYTSDLIWNQIYDHTDIYLKMDTAFAGVNVSSRSVLNANAMSLNLKALISNSNVGPGSAGLLTNSGLRTPYSTASVRILSWVTLLAFIAMEHAFSDESLVLDEENYVLNWDVGNFNGTIIDARDYCVKWLIYAKGFNNGTYAYNNVTDFYTSKIAYDKALSNSDFAAINNKVFPAIRTILNQFASLSLFINGGNADIMYPENASTNVTDSYIQSASSYKYAIVYDSINNENPYLIPPKTAFNIWARLAITTAVIVAISVTVAVASYKIKRAISYKAAVKRASLAQKISRFNDPDSPDYGNRALYNQIYKDNRRYNRFWGRLSGTTYDGFNDWIEYPGAGSSVNNSLLSTVIDTVDSVATGSAEKVSQIRSIVAKE